MAVNARLNYHPDEAAIKAHLAASDVIGDLLQERVDFACDFWRTRSIRRTGHNAESVRGRVVRGAGPQYGEVEAFSHYARYREFGTRYNRPERVLQQAMAAIEAM